MRNYLLLPLALSLSLPLPAAAVPVATITLESVPTEGSTYSIESIGADRVMIRVAARAKPSMISREISYHTSKQGDFIEYSIAFPLGSTAAIASATDKIRITFDPVTGTLPNAHLRETALRAPEQNKYAALASGRADMLVAAAAPASQSVSTSADGAAAKAAKEQLDKVVNQYKSFSVDLSMPETPASTPAESSRPCKRPAVSKDWNFAVADFSSRWKSR